MLKSIKSCSGQVMTEYAIMLAMSIGIVVMMIFLMAIFSEYGARLISLVSMEYP